MRKQSSSGHSESEVGGKDLRARCLETKAGCVMSWFGGARVVGFYQLGICACQDSGLPQGGSRYLIIKELGLQDHDYYGFWGLSP